jgi:hypothetical protein
MYTVHCFNPRAHLKRDGAREGLRAGRKPACACGRDFLLKKKEIIDV